MDQLDVEFADVQGGVIKPHGRNYSAIIIFNWRQKSSMSERSRWLKLMSPRITTHKRQLEAIKRYKEGKLLGKKIQETFITIGLGQPHFDQLGANNASNKYWVDKNNDTDIYTPRWVDVKKLFGIKTARTVVLIIANDNEILLNKEVRSIKQSLRWASLYKKNSFAVHFGVRSKYYHPSIKGMENETSLDPFGFLDNVTSTRDKDEIIQTAFNSDLKDGNDLSIRGTYLAFIKIMTYGDKFNQRVSEMAKSINSNVDFDHHDVEYSKALLMGRYSDGVSLMERPRGDGEMPLSHTPVDFLKDDKGLRCPFGAHTRIVHSEEGDFSGKIIRRSVPYYDWASFRKIKNLRKRVVKSEGLLFLSFQRNLQEQFVPLIKKMKFFKDYIFYYRSSGTIERPPLFFFDKKEKKYSQLPLEDGDLNFSLTLGEHYFFFPELSFFTEGYK